VIFDFFPVKLAACLKPPSRANYRITMTYWKDATTLRGLWFNPQRVIWVIAKMTFQPFQPPCWICVTGEEWKVPNWAKGGMHQKRMGTTAIKYGSSQWLDQPVTKFCEHHEGFENLCKHHDVFENFWLKGRFFILFFKFYNILTSQVN